MATTLVCTRFGQQGPASDRLDMVAHSIVSAMGDGKPAAWAGFVWYRPGYQLLAATDRRRELLSDTPQAAA